ncbi:MAG: hypothetical protein HOP15_13280 [Planctomycetes bacterium]|nr:hypothetical protein [Planctomycetota bacterium]
MLLAALLFALQIPAPDGAAPDLAAPRARGWGDFPVFVWREKYAGKPLPDELALPFGGVILMREEDSAWARERGLSYLVWNVAGRDALHLDADEAWNARVEKWIETRDEKLLVREPCLNDPATIERLYTTMDATRAKHGEHPGLGFVLGDEVGLTPNGDPFDLCRCGFCEVKWKQHARENGLPERAPLTDEVRVALLQDDHSLLGAWLALRRFNERCVRETVLNLRERGLGSVKPKHGWSSSRSLFGKIPFGLLGCGAPAAFGATRHDLCADLFDFVECYPVAEAREQLLSFPHTSVHGGHGFAGQPSTSGATLATIFVADETPDGAAWRVWEHWLRGGRGLVLWSDSALERHPEHLARLAQAVSDIRSLMKRGIVTLLEQNGGAIVTDADSVAASFLREALMDGPTWPRRRAGYQAEHGVRERKVRSWLRWIEDAGFLPAALPLDAVQGDCASEYGFLVLPEILVVNETDVVHLEQFVAAGGTLFVDGTLGWVDRHGLPREEDLFERLRAKDPERVLRPPAELASYLDTRLAPERTGKRTAAQSLAARGSWWLALEPYLGDGARAFPWLAARSQNGAFVLLPNLTDSEQRRGLRDLELGMPLEQAAWIHPRNGEPLRAGDAAVLMPKLYRPRPMR